MSNTVVGLMLIDAPHSALNNAGSGAGDRTDNIVRVKTIRKGMIRYPYVSGQALRYWWRETLENKFEWDMSPISRKDKIAFTSANPIDYPDDDMFGYMRALNKKDGGTVTRISPLKNSPLIAVVGQNPTEDFGVMSRQEGDPVLYNHEFYSNVLKGIFSIDLGCVGVFSEIEKTGYKNMSKDLLKLAEERKLIHEEDKWIMDKDSRIKRTQDVINALPYLHGGAKSALHLTDVTPKIIVLAAIDGGNHIFMNIVREEKGNVVFDLDALDEVISDYSDIIKSDIFIGIRTGFLKDTQNKIMEYAENKNNIHVGTIKEMTDKFSNEIPKLI